MSRLVEALQKAQDAPSVEEDGVDLDRLPSDEDNDIQDIEALESSLSLDDEFTVLLESDGDEQHHDNLHATNDGIFLDQVENLYQDVSRSHDEEVENPEESSQNDAASAKENLEEGLHSEEYSDTSLSIAVMFEEQGAGEKAVRHWLYGGIAVLVICAVAGLLYQDIKNGLSTIFGLNAMEQPTASVRIDRGVVSREPEAISDEFESAVAESSAQSTVGDVDASVTSKSGEADSTASTSSKSAEIANKKAVVNKQPKLVSGIEFSRVKKAPDSSLALDLGYESYLQADYESALSQYKKALEYDGTNIDANLGVASSLYALGDYENAASYFDRVLAVDQFHALALARKNELALLLDKQALDTRALPESDAYFSGEAKNHFYLGQAYASQAKWPDAQKAFFKAHSMAPGNDLYAYNLAVALDQMQKHQLALPYYEQVLVTQNSDLLDYEKIKSRVETIISAGME